MFNLIKRKNKPIQVKAYTTYENGVQNAYPPKVSKQPNWATKLKTPSRIQIARECANNNKEVPSGLNIKTCPGRMDLYNKGIMVPLWSDLYIKITRDSETNELNWNYQFADMKSQINFHPYFQYAAIAPEGKYLQLKLMSPWHFATDEQINFIAIKPAWELDELYGLEILPGVLNFYHQTQVNINLFIKAPEKEQEYLLKAGTPIYHFIPLSDRRTQLEVKAVSPHDPEWINLNKWPRYSFFKDYRKHITED